MQLGWLSFAHHPQLKAKCCLIIIIIIVILNIVRFVIFINITRAEKCLVVHSLGGHTAFSALRKVEASNRERERERAREVYAGFKDSRGRDLGYR